MGTDNDDLINDTGAIDYDDLLAFFPDHPEAADLLMLVWDVIQAWDDAYDGDPADHHDGYTKAVVKLPCHQLYKPCSVSFLMAQCYYDWMTANDMETAHSQEEDMDGLRKAYMLRAGYFRIIISMMHQLRGLDVTVQEAPVIWRMYIEDWDEYVQEMTDAQNR